MAFLFISFSSPHYVIEHRHEDNSSLELFWFAHFVHELLDFLDELQCSESSENIPLEFHRFSFNCVRSSVIVMNLWNNPAAVPKKYLMLGSGSPFQDTTQYLSIQKTLACERLMTS